MTDQPVAIDRRAVMSGLVPAVHEIEAPLWTGGANIVFRHGAARPAPGYAAFATPQGTAPVRGLLAMRDQSRIQHVVWGDPAALYRWTPGLGVTDVSREGGYAGRLDDLSTGPASAWSFAQFGDWVLATNGVDAPQIFKPDVGQFAGLNTDGAFTLAEVFLRRGPYVLALNTGGQGRLVAWSDTGDPESWLAASENNAGDLTMTELSGPIRAGAVLRDRVAVLSGNELQLLSLVGGNAVFSAAPALKGVGAVGKQAVTAVGARLYGVSRQGIYETDGVSHRYLDDPILRDVLQARVNWDQASKIVAWHDEDDQTVWFFLPVDGAREPTAAWGWNYADGVWTHLTYGRTTALYRRSFPDPIAADANGRLFFHQRGDGEAPRPCRLRTKPLDLGAAGRRKTVSRVRLHIDGVRGGGVRCRLGAQTALDRAIDWGPWQPIITDNPVIDVRASGQYIRFEIEAPSPADHFALAGLELYVNVRGTRR